MAKLIEDGKKKIKDLDSDALAEDINSKFKNLHIMAIEYSQAVARAGLFLSCAHVSVGRIAIFKIYFVITYVTLYSHILTNRWKGFRMRLPVFSDILSQCFSMVRI